MEKTSVVGRSEKYNFLFQAGKYKFFLYIDF